MSHTHASVLVHCVFSTKNRANLIPDCDAMWRYLAVLAKDNKVTLLAAGGTANHVHLLLAVPPVRPLAKIIFKRSRGAARGGYTSTDTDSHGRKDTERSASASRSGRRSFITSTAKAEHHKKWSFEQEFMTLLKKSGIEYDARFVFG